MHVVNEFALVNVPVPLDVHVVPALFVALEPVVIFTAAEEEQVVIAVPATAVGAAVMVSDFVDVALEQPEAIAVRVRVTPPAEISAALGVYVAVVNDVELAKLPVPLDDHKTLVWLVALEPAVIAMAPDE